MTVVEAPAKLTLSLRVTGVRPDGYHLLDTEMITVDLADRLDIGAGDSFSVIGGGGGVGRLGGVGGVPAGADNLVRRALELIGRRAAVELHKRIPAGAGLGGGSADAAAILRWAGVGDLAVAAQLGADVPFCLVGGRARVTGIGDEVAPLPFGEVADRMYTLLTPPFHVSTVEVYRAWDALGGPVAGGPNDLEPAALAVAPRLAEWRERLGQATGQTPVLAGSGGTWFVPGAFPGGGRVVVRPVCP